MTMKNNMKAMAVEKIPRATNAAIALKETGLCGHVAMAIGV
ncbi:unannotated protein [freshwater metagenome]|uniref:Unannotated protein n=1 Tax=freshwater metagenome TaxID=449393 RepID=A0A6J7PXU9_9ZZZZ